MENKHIQLDVHRISNVVTIRTLHLSKEVKDYLDANIMYSHSLTIMVNSTTKFNENSIYLGLDDNKDRIGFYGFTSDNRAKRFLEELEESLIKFTKHIMKTGAIKFVEGKQENFQF